MECALGNTFSHVAPLPPPPRLLAAPFCPPAHVRRGALTRSTRECARAHTHTNTRAVNLFVLRNNRLLFLFLFLAALSPPLPFAALMFPHSVLLQSVSQSSFFSSHFFATFFFLLFLSLRLYEFLLKSTFVPLEFVFLFEFSHWR